jgi:hypothetical protein
MWPWENDMKIFYFWPTVKINTPKQNSTEACKGINWASEASLPWN